MGIKFDGIDDDTVAQESQQNVGGVHDNVSAPRRDLGAERAARSTATAGRGFEQLMYSLQSSNKLTEAATGFLESVRKQVSNQNKKIQFFDLPKTCTSFFVDGAECVGFVFEEALRESQLRKGSDTILMEVMKDFETATIDKKGAEKILDIVIVTADSYGKSNVWSNFVVNTLRSDDYASLKFANMNANNVRYSLVSDLRQVKEMFSDMSPHATPARIDFGCSVTMEVMPDDRRDYTREDHDEIPIGVIGGYTRFYLIDDLQDVKFQPVICISDIQSNIRNHRVLPILLASFLDYAVNAKGWLSPYSQFGPNNPNLGNLWIDPETDQPVELESLDRLDRFVRAKFLEPVVVCEIQPGRAGIPSLWRYADPKQQGFMLQDLAEYLNAPQIADLGELFVPHYEHLSYSGYVQDRGVWIDTREIDYFRAIGITRDRDLRDRFIIPEDDMSAEIDNIKELGFKEVRRIWTTYPCSIATNSLEQILVHMGAGGGLALRTDYKQRMTVSVSSYTDLGRGMRDILQRNQVTNRFPLMERGRRSLRNLSGR